METPVDILNELISDLVLLVQRTMIDNGVDSNSKLLSTIEFIEKDNGLQLLANDYFQYVSTGRKPKARKVPIEDLILWIKSKGIGSGKINNIAWAIQKTIFENGIKGKNYLDPVEENVADLSSEQLVELLSEVIANEMVMAFEPLTK